MQEKKTKSKNDRLNSTRQTIRFEDDLLTLIQQQAKKDGESFAGWVKAACKMRLSK